MFNFKNYTLYTLFYFFPITIFAQSGVITYGYKFNNNVESDIDAMLKDDIMTKKAIDLTEKLKQIEFKLFFNKYESIYKLSDNTLYSDQSFNTAILVSGANSKHYTDRKNNLKIRQVDYKGQLIDLIVNNIVYDWTITKETKKIGKYLCYKATTHEEKLSRGSKNLLIFDHIVWFTYEIPVAFGPKGYDGLPGLVLEASANQKTFYYAKEIVFDQNKERKIKLPKSDKTMTETEFNKLFQN